MDGSGLCKVGSILGSACRVAEADFLAKAGTERAACPDYSPAPTRGLSRRVHPRKMPVPCHLQQCAIRGNQRCAQVARRSNQDAVRLKASLNRADEVVFLGPRDGLGLKELRI